MMSKREKWTIGVNLWICAWTVFMSVRYVLNHNSRESFTPKVAVVLGVIMSLLLVFWIVKAVQDYRRAERE